ncbi:MAG: hypothetical protein CTY15_05170 [Methylocystis sp.]|nr:MAG: hypothetical protein CTY15_05170 [Methylocystis sp.]
MFFKLPKSLDITETGLRLTGVSLAAASVVFAAQMTSGPAQSPQISGIEHLAIYARPAARRGQIPQIDYTPIGSTTSAFPDGVLRGYRIIQADPTGALIRLPEGRLRRVAPGAPVEGLGTVASIYQRGGKWTVVTPRGLIRD